MGSRKNKMQWASSHTEEWRRVNLHPPPPPEEFPPPSFTDLDVTVETSCGPTPY